MVDFVSAKKGFSRVQWREYEVQKVTLFAATGDVEYSICEAVCRASRIKG